MRVGFRDMVFQLFFRSAVLAIPIHEYGHLLVLRLLEIGGEIRSTHLSLTFPSQTLSGTDATLFYGAGGFFQALIFGIMTIKNKDYENKLINIWIAVWGLISGIFEALAPRIFWGPGAMIGFVCAFLVVTFILVRQKPELVF